MSSDNIPDVYEQRATKMAINAASTYAATSAAGTAALAYVGLGAFAGPVGMLAGLAIGALMGGGKEHGKAIPKDVKKQTKLLESGNPNDVSKALETAGRRLSNWGTCKSKGSGCLPHREGTLQALASHGVVVPEICVKRGGKECTAQFGDVTAAYMAARFREGQEPMSWQQLSGTSIPTFSLTDTGIGYGAPSSSSAGGSSGWASALLDLTKLGVTAYASERQAKAAEEQRKAVVAATAQLQRDAAVVAGQTPQTPGSVVVPGREGATWDPAMALALALGTGAGSDGDRGAGSTVIMPQAGASVSPLLIAALAGVGLLIYLRS